MPEKWVFKMKVITIMNLCLFQTYFLKKIVLNMIVGYVLHEYVLWVF
jgi:hypothetical protein